MLTHKRKRDLENIQEVLGLRLQHPEGLRKYLVNGATPSRSNIRMLVKNAMNMNWNYSGTRRKYVNILTALHKHGDLNKRDHMTLFESSNPRLRAWQNDALARPYNYKALLAHGNPTPTPKPLPPAKRVKAGNRIVRNSRTPCRDASIVIHNKTPTFNHESVRRYYEELIGNGVAPKARDLLMRYIEYFDRDEGDFKYLISRGDIAELKDAFVFDNRGRIVRNDKGIPKTTMTQQIVKKNTVIGAALLQVRDEDVHIHAIVSTIACKGHGSAMIEYVENLARSRGKKYVTLESLEQPKGFYRKMGYAHGDLIKPGRVKFFGNENGSTKTYIQERTSYRMRASNLRKHDLFPMFKLLKPLK